ncbi:c-type cytochrome [Methyloligella halotolerans]|uniref:SorU family sulfite dehydrogenase c-type cytochrome subunit n=1 Tax=Methyloligella halotolerans TaxID=1177755 RepID=UPI003CC94EDA
MERAQPSCTICHTLADAGSDGSIGPVLDDLKPSAEQVRLAVTLGVGPMQPYTDKLSKDEIEALAYYVSTVTGGAEAAKSE